MMSGTSVEEAVKMVSKWAAAYYTHLNSCYKLPVSHTVMPLASHQNLEANLTVDNQKRESDAWTITSGKYVGQRNLK